MPELLTHQPLVAGQDSEAQIPRWWGPAGFLITITIVAYIPAFWAGWVWDDDQYVTRNPLLLTTGGLWRIWFSLDSPSQYFPLVYTTFWFEYRLWGLNPMGYHVVNVLLHGINAVLVWTLLTPIIGRASLLAAAIFALHPVHVESVAWVTERKNTLSMLFMLLAMLAWWRFVDPLEPHKRKYYGLAFGSYALALFAKTTACTLPAGLVLLAWLRGVRLDLRRWGQIAPFVVWGLAMGLLTVWWERNRQGTGGEMFEFSIAERFLIAGRALWFYLWKLVWPTNLAFSYPRWNIDDRELVQYLWPAAVVVVALVLWFSRHRIPRITAALTFFAATLVPMLGFISLYTFRYSFVADHYQYVASIGPIAIAAALIYQTRRHAVADVVSRYVLPGLILIVLGTLTWRQATAYENVETLWRDTLAKNPTSSMANNHLGLIHLERGEQELAGQHFRRAIELAPDNLEALLNLGVFHRRIGDMENAERIFREVIDREPRVAEAYENLAMIYSVRGDPYRSIEKFRRALAIKPNKPSTRVNLAVELATIGRKEEAVAECREALRADPRDQGARELLIILLNELGRFDEAAQVRFGELSAP